MLRDLKDVTWPKCIESIVWLFNIFLLDGVNAEIKVCDMRRIFTDKMWQNTAKCR